MGPASCPSASTPGLGCSRGVSPGCKGHDQDLGRHRGPGTQEHGSWGPLSAIRAPLFTRGPGRSFPSRGYHRSRARQAPAPSDHSGELKALQKCLLATSEEISHKCLCGRLSSPQIGQQSGRRACCRPSEPGSAHSKHLSSRPDSGLPGPCRRDRPTPGFPGLALIGLDPHRPSR